MDLCAAYDLVLRLRERTGMDFDPHWCRHAFATRSLRDGVPVEVVSRLLGHSSITTTVSVYGHLTAEDARRALEAAGWFSPGTRGDLVSRLVDHPGGAGLVAAAGGRRAGRDPGRRPGLPVIAWTVGPAGSVLTGQVNGLAPAAQVR